jgi:hypothetical protein
VRRIYLHTVDGVGTIPSSIFKASHGMQQTKNYPFHLEAIRKLRFHFCLLIDPRNRKAFYVGKGKGEDNETSKEIAV